MMLRFQQAHKKYRNLFNKIDVLPVCVLEMSTFVNLGTTAGFCYQKNSFEQIRITMAIEEINFTANDVNFVLLENEKQYHFKITKEELESIYLVRYPAASSIDHQTIFDQYKIRMFQIAKVKVAKGVSNSYIILITARDYFSKT